MEQQQQQQHHDHDDDGRPSPAAQQSLSSLQPPSDQLHHPSPRPPRSRSPLFSLTPISTTSSTPSRTRAESPTRRPSTDPSETLDLPSYVSSRLKQSSVDSAMSDAPPANSKTTNGAATPPHKSRSILNLTSSTLFGIYAKSGFDTNRDEPETPRGTGTQTPSVLHTSGSGIFDANRSFFQLPLDTQSRRASSPTRGHGSPTSTAPPLSPSRPQPQDHSRRRKPLTRWQHTANLLARAVALFLLGVSYGLTVTHLHDKRSLAPVKVRINRGTWFYLGCWGSLSVLLGFLLPWVDRQSGLTGPGDGLEHVYDAVGQTQSTSPDAQKGQIKSPSGKHAVSSVPNQIGRLGSDGDPASEQAGAEWNPILRSIGAFAGIAFAISTLQVSLTLLLVNPVLWYALDRTKTGFALSLVTGISGVAVLLGMNSNLVPGPASASTGTMGSEFSGSAAGPSASASALHSRPSYLDMPVLSAGFASKLGLMSAGRYLTLEGLGVAAWILSVFFCSCVCFGNVGRRFVRGLS